LITGGGFTSAIFGISGGFSTGRGAGFGFGGGGSLYFVTSRTGLRISGGARKVRSYLVLRVSVKSSGTMRRIDSNTPCKPTLVQNTLVREPTCSSDWKGSGRDFGTEPPIE